MIHFKNSNFKGGSVPKKILALTLAVLFMTASVVAALSVLPHSHGKDFNHAHHEDCPVYQISICGFVATHTVSAAVAVFLLVGFVFLEIPFYFCDRVTFYQSLRAPPTSSIIA